MNLENKLENGEWSRAKVSAIGTALFLGVMGLVLEYQNPGTLVETYNGMSLGEKFLTGVLVITLYTPLGLLRKFEKDNENSE